MLNSAQFQVLNCYRRFPGATHRFINEQTGLSLGSINTAKKELVKMGLIGEDGTVGARGMKALEPYKVDNAIIMAAGLSSRFVPLSYEKPKGILNVQGEVLIERQIRQLIEAGITDITVIVGYKKEAFFYLEDDYGVKIIVNDEYATRNNNSTIKKVEHILGNTYICSSDDYFTENPFEDYVYCSYYSAVFVEGDTPEYCLKTRGKDKRIVDVAIGGANSWVMLGHVYWDRSFSREFCRILNEIYDNPATADKLWEDIYREHIDRLPMVMREYPHGIIWEFDSLEELRAFDPNFIENVDSQIMQNICAVLDCTHYDIQEFSPISKGLTNLSCRFMVRGEPYIYRHPGPSTDGIINRRSEMFSEEVARELGLDDTFIHEDPDKGWKISRFMPDCTELDYANEAEVAQALALIRRLHDSNTVSEFEFDVFAEALKIEDMLNAESLSMFRDYQAIRRNVVRAAELAQQHGARRCLCHNDFYAPNILVRQGNVTIIDWEYSGMADYASDLGTFICCAADYTYEDALHVYELYFGHTPSQDELLHCVAMTAVSSFYWLVWALYKESQGEHVGEYLHLWYKVAKTYAKQACLLAGE